MNEKINKILPEGDKFLSEMYLIRAVASASLGKHSKHGFTYSACR